MKLDSFQLVLLGLVLTVFLGIGWMAWYANQFTCTEYRVVQVPEEPAHLAMHLNVTTGQMVPVLDPGHMAYTRNECIAWEEK